MDLRKQKVHTNGHTHIYTHAYTCMYVKSIFILFTLANYGHIDSIDFPNVHMHTRANKSVLLNWP